jgi:quercetin dioxygenase-like cupin family protein
MKRTFIAAAMATVLAGTSQAADAPGFHMAGAAVKAEAKAGYSVKTFAFPPGAIKVISFDNKAPKPYALADETQFYVLSGAVTTEVGGQAVELAAGDVAHAPKGRIAPKAGAGPTVVIAHRVRSAVAEPKPAVIRGAEVPEGLAVQWMQDGKPQSATTEDAAKAAPPSAGRFYIKRYAFDGNSIRVVNLKKGGRTNTTAYQTNNIIYLTKGRMMRHVGDQAVEVRAGDAIIEQAGTSGYWQIAEDSQFVSTTAIAPTP